MIVVVTAEAEADIEQIAAYVAEQSPQSSLTLVRSYGRDAHHCWTHRAAIRWCRATSISAFDGVPSAGF